MISLFFCTFAFAGDITLTSNQIHKRWEKNNIDSSYNK